MTNTRIQPQQLRVGLYVRLDIPWMRHPFLSNAFKIRSEAQVRTLRRLGLAEIEYDPGRSDTTPLPLETPSPESSQTTEADEDPLWEQKRARIERLKRRRVQLNRCSKHYQESLCSVRKAMDLLFAEPATAVKAAGKVVDGLLGELSAEEGAALQLVNMKPGEENTWFHVVNVAVLALLLGKHLGLDPAQLRLLGTGALLHDLGHNFIPSSLRLKREPLSPPEEAAYRRHPQLGHRAAARLGVLPTEVLDIILQHHERLDGSGWPQGLKGSAIGPLVRIIALVNRYDNLCNLPRFGLSPHGAVARLYARERAGFDPQMLQTFIAHLGIYPPGSLVTLADDRLATVIAVNPSDRLHPQVMVYEPSIPSSEALILDLAEEGLEIAATPRRSEVDPEVLAYLNLGEKLAYYLDSGRA